MQRFDYFIRRLLLIIPTFLGITVVCFSLIQFVPGGPVEQMMLRVRGLGEAETAPTAGAAATVTEEYRRQLERHYGFDRPLYERYWRWLVDNRLGLDMESYKYPNRTAWEVIQSRFRVSLIFGITSFVLTYLICIPLGIAKALRQGSAFDVGSSVLVFAGYAMPAFALGMVLKMLFCGTVDGFWDWFPVAGFESDNFAAMSLGEKIADRFYYMFLPLICYVSGNFAVLTVLMKNSLLDQIGSDYIRTVLARGGTFRRAVWGHAFRNALIPIATGFGGILTLMFAGSVVIEQVFEIPGMGRLSLEAIVGRDYPVFMAILSITSLLGLLGNVLSDLCYVLIDPRIHFRK
ncbi:MAG TPA: ABC transporter permease subunit [Kiritimatiellia bacterium]|nr:ABC transporter permease subunit [Kiritimatiellia bacterium]HMO99594.1 ABC transporter permease subunit [Kiritimatiellia bacterium]HMP96017.1 ABC transporter permease subunit [Kiritimatiellia bacterium]